MYDPKAYELFDELETVTIDPYIEKVIAQAVELEGILNDPEISLSTNEYDQITIRDIEKETIAKLDAECPHIHKTVLVTGTVLRAYYDDLEEEYRTVEVELDSQPVTSMGYSTLAFNVGEPEEKIVVGHIFHLESGSAFRHEPGLVDYIPRLYGFAPVGQVDIRFDAPDIENIQKLQQQIPELIDEVDRWIDGEDDECQALMRLKRMKISTDLDIPHDILSALLSYTHTRLDFDTAVPYEVVIHGLNYDANSIGSDQITFQYFQEKPGLVLAYPTALILMPYPSVRDKQIHMSSDLQWHVELRVLSVDPKKEELNFTVPVRNIRDMHSVRSLFNGQ